MFWIFCQIDYICFCFSLENVKNYSWQNSSNLIIVNMNFSIFCWILDRSVTPSLTRAVPFPINIFFPNLFVGSLSSSLLHIFNIIKN